MNLTKQRKNFIRYTKVFPFVGLTNWKPSPHVLRRVIGVSEVVGGLVLAVVPGELFSTSQFFITQELYQINNLIVIFASYLLRKFSGPLKHVANITLLLSCIYITYSHVTLHDPIEKMTSPIIFGLLLICRFIVRIQVNSREARQAEEASKKTKYDEVIPNRNESGCYNDHSHHKGCTAKNAEIKKVK